MEVLKNLPSHNIDISAYNLELLEAKTQHEILSSKIKDQQTFSSVLDIGSSSGAFLHYMYDRGYKRLVGFEPHRKLARVKEHPIAIEIYEQIFQFDKMKHERFDLICVHQSSELSLNPKRFLDSLKVILKPTGVLMLANGMNKKTVKTLLEESGFEVMSQDYYPETLTLNQWVTLTRWPQWLKDTLLELVFLFRMENLHIKLRRGSLATCARRI